MRGAAAAPARGSLSSAYGQRGQGSGTRAGPLCPLPSVCDGSWHYRRPQEESEAGNESSARFSSGPKFCLRNNGNRLSISRGAEDALVGPWRLDVAA